MEHKPGKKKKTTTGWTRPIGEERPRTNPATAVLAIERLKNTYWANINFYMH